MKTNLFKSEFKLEKGKEKKYEDTIIEFIQNFNNPLKERWNIFIQSEFGEVDPFIWHPETFERFYGTTECTLEDAMYSTCERKALIEATDMVQLLTEQVGLSFDVVKYIKHVGFVTRTEIVTQEDVNELKKEILNEYLAGFVYDF